jgi:hypothetical protein
VHVISVEDAEATAQSSPPMLTLTFEESLPKFCPVMVIKVFESLRVFGETDVGLGVAADVNV